MKKSAGVVPSVSGKGLKIGIVVSRFNGGITKKMLDGAEKALRAKNVARLETVWVPGAFEIPLALRSLARGGKFDALLALGAVIRGDTPHFDYVCEGAAHGTMQVMLDTGVPIAFGVLTTDTLRQAQERTGGKHGNKGVEAALTALEMARLVKMYG